MSKEALTRRVLANSGHRHLPVRAPRHPHRADRPPRARHARVPRRLRAAPDRHLAEVRPRLLHRLGQRLRTTARATRSTSRRSTTRRSSATRDAARSPRPRSARSSRFRAVMQPTELISLMDLGGPSFAMGDHADHIHVGWRPLLGLQCQARTRSARRILSANQWDRFVDRICGHPQPGRAHEAFEVLDQGQAQARLEQAALEPRPPGRVAGPRRPPRQLFRFCQLDFPFALGPADGRYLERSPAGEDLAVVVFAALHAERASRLRGRRPSKLPPGAERAGAGADHARDGDRAPSRSTTRARRATGCSAAAAAASTGGEEIATALAHVNHAVAAYRVCAADPHAHDVSRDQALRVRLGYGTGAELVDGGWDEALVVPGEHSRPRVRRRMLAPRAGAGGHPHGPPRGVQPSEELLLRARLDLDAGRQRRSGAAGARRRRGAAAPSSRAKAPASRR